MTAGWLCCVFAFHVAYLKGLEPLGNKLPSHRDDVERLVDFASRRDVVVTGAQKSATSRTMPSFLNSLRLSVAGYILSAGNNVRLATRTLEHTTFGGLQ